MWMPTVIGDGPQNWPFPVGLEETLTIVYGAKQPEMVVALHAAGLLMVYEAAGEPLERTCTAGTDAPVLSVIGLGVENSTMY